MSRLAKKPISIPEGVTIEVRDGSVVVKGAKGDQTLRMGPRIKVTAEKGLVTVQPKDQSVSSALVGTAWALIRNALEGVSRGFAKTLEIEGVGYRAAMEGDTLVLSLGFVNPVRFPVPQGIKIEVQKNMITISGIDKELVGKTAARIRDLKKPEPYKGKGIRYQGEVIRRKVGKKAATAAAA